MAIFYAIEQCTGKAYFLQWIMLNDPNENPCCYPSECFWIVPGTINPLD